MGEGKNITPKIRQNSGKFVVEVEAELDNFEICDFPPKLVNIDKRSQISCHIVESNNLISQLLMAGPDSRSSAKYLNGEPTVTSEKQVAGPEILWRL